MLDPISLLFALFAGAAAGAAGIFPFAHPNSIVIAFNSFFANPLQAGVFFASLGAVHLVFSCFPAVFFGLPSAAQGVSVLPAHSLALQGRGLEALHAMLYAIFGGLLIALAFAPAFFFFASFSYPFFEQFTLPALLVAVALFFFSEKNLRKIAAGAGVFLLSGIFGFIILSFSFIADPLLPLLTGLFGLPLLLLSFSASPPPVQLPSAQVSVSNSHVATGVLLGAASTFVPAVSPAVVSSAAFLFIGESSPLNFLALSTAVSASKAVFDVESVFSIGKARSGVAAAVSQALGGFSDPWIVLLAVGAAGFTALSVALFFARPIALRFSSLPHKKVSLLVLAAAIIGIFASGGALGLAIAVVACLIGLVPPLAGLRHAYLTGALLLPTLLYYSGASHYLLSFIRGG